MLMGAFGGDRRRLGRRDSALVGVVLASGAGRRSALVVAIVTVRLSCRQHGHRPHR